MNRTYIITGLAIVLISALATYAMWQQGGQQPRYDRIPNTASTTQGTATTTPEGEVPENRPPISSGYGAATVALNQVLTYPGDLSLRPVAIVEDSRCPQNARCVQAGKVVVSVRISSGLGVAVHTFEPGTTITTEAETVTLLSVQPHSTAGEIIAENEYRFTFEVLRRNAPGTGTSDGCYVGGCSSQLCTDDPNAVSTCEYRSEYVCYLVSRCERQPSGQCGWTPTPAFNACMENPPDID